jgi:hypothetical protein
LYAATAFAFTRAVSKSLYLIIEFINPELNASPAPTESIGLIIKAGVLIILLSE